MGYKFGVIGISFFYILQASLRFLVVFYPRGIFSYQIHDFQLYFPGSEISYL